MLTIFMKSRNAFEAGRAGKWEAALIKQHTGCVGEEK